MRRITTTTTTTSRMRVDTTTTTIADVTTMADDRTIESEHLKQQGGETARTMKHSEAIVHHHLLCVITGENRSLNRSVQT